MEVEGVGPATFTQAAGFLKLLEGENPLDRTWVHPESYPAALKLLEKFGFAADVVRDKVRLPELRAQLAQADVPALAAELGIGEFTLRDIIEALGRPERDPRDDLPKPIFKKGVLKLEDLTAGMELKGTVLNVVDFGAFVNIGLKDSGLVHISQLANRYVKSPHDVVSVGDVVTVWVMGVDQERKRVSLTMVKPGTERHRGPQAGGRRGGPGGEPRDPNREREGRGPGQGRRGAGGGRGPRPPGSALTSPPVGAPSVAVLAEAPARRPDRDRDHGRDRDRGPGPGGPRRPGWDPAARRDDTAPAPDRAAPPVRGVPIAGPAATDRLVSIAIGIEARPRGRPAGHLARAPRLPRSPRMPWPAMSRSGPSASSSSSGKPRVEGPEPEELGRPGGSAQQPADHATRARPHAPAMHGPNRPNPRPRRFRRSPRRRLTRSKPWRVYDFESQIPCDAAASTV